MKDFIFDLQRFAVCKIGETEYESFSAALNAATGNATITIISDFTLVSGDDIKKNITLDLNGHTISTGYTYFYVGSEYPSYHPTVTIKDSSTGKTGKITGGHLQNRGKLTIEGGIIDCEIQNLGRDNGSLTITGGTFNKNISNYSSTISISSGKFYSGFNFVQRASYLADNYKAQKNSDGWTVSTINSGENFYSVNNNSVNNNSVTVTSGGVNKSGQIKSGSEIQISYFHEGEITFDNAVTNIQENGDDIEIYADSTKILTIKNLLSKTTYEFGEISAEKTSTCAKKISAGANIDAENKKLVHQAAESTDLFTISGITSTTGITVENNVVTLTAANLGDENITLNNSGENNYTLALADDVTKRTEKNSWSVDNDTANYKKTLTAGYSLSSDGKTINFTEKTTEKTLFTVSGVDSTDGLTVDENNKTVTVASSSLGEKNVSVTGGYKISLAEDVKISEKIPAGFEVEGNTAIYKKTSTTEGYKLSGNKIIYVEESGGEEILQIENDSAGFIDGVKISTDSAGNITSISGLANNSTVTGAENISVKIENNKTLTVDGVTYKISNDSDGVTLKNGEITNASTNCKIEVEQSGTYKINGEKISANVGDSIVIDRAKIPYIYSEEIITAENFEEKITENVSEENIFKIDSTTSSIKAAENSVVINDETAAKVIIFGSENSTIKASGGANEKIDLADGKNAVVVASNGAKILNYNPENSAAFLMSDFSNILSAIRNQSITFDDNNIKFLGNKINFDEISSDDEFFSANLYNNSKSERREISWSANSGGTVDESDSKKSKILVGNYSTEKNSANLIGGSGKDYIFAGSGDSVNGGDGNNFIELQNKSTSDGAKIFVNESRGVDKISGFTAGFEDNSDRLNISDTSNLKISSKNGKLQVKNGSRKIIFEDLNSSDDGEVYKILFETDDGEEKFAFVGENSTIRVADSENAADKYIGSGKTSAIDFSDFGENISINLSEENFQNIGVVKGGGGENILIGDANKNTLIAGTGSSSLWSASGNDLLIGNTSTEKESSTEFFFTAGDGKDTIKNFEFLTEDNADTADKINFYNQEITGVYLRGDNVEIKFGDDSVKIVDAKNKLIQVDDGELHGYRVGNNLTFDNFTTNFYGNDNATITVSENFTGNANIFLDGSDGKIYKNIEVLDAGNFEGSATLVGGANSEKIFASQNNSSLWGGVGGNDTLIGGDGDDEFFYIFGGGDDVINNATENDVVNIFATDLNQITDIEATTSQIKFSFSDSGILTINSTENVGFKFGETIYQFDRQNKTWLEK